MLHSHPKQHQKCTCLNASGHVNLPNIWTEQFKKLKSEINLNTLANTNGVCKML